MTSILVISPKAHTASDESLVILCFQWFMLEGAVPQPVNHYDDDDEEHSQRSRGHNNIKLVSFSTIGIYKNLNFSAFCCFGVLRAPPTSFKAITLYPKEWKWTGKLMLLMHTKCMCKLCNTIAHSENSRSTSSQHVTLFSTCNTIVRQSIKQAWLSSAQRCNSNESKLERCVPPSSSIKWKHSITNGYLDCMLKIVSITLLCLLAKIHGRIKNVLHKVWGMWREAEVQEGECWLQVCR